MTISQLILVAVIICMLLYTFSPSKEEKKASYKASDVLRQYALISRCIESCFSAEQLDTCRMMIRERIAMWNVPEIVNLLYNELQVREVELIVSRYPIHE